MCADLPSGWETALLGKLLVSPDALRRELLSITTDDLNAILVQAQPGKGNLNLLKTMPLPAPGAAAPIRQRYSGKRAAKPAPSGENPVLQPASVEPAARSPAATAPLQPSAPAPLRSRPTSQVESGHPASRFARLLAGSEDKNSSGCTRSPRSPPQKTETPVTTGKPKIQNIAAQPVRRPVPVSKTAASRPAAKTGRFVSSRTTGELPEIKRPTAHRRGIFRGLAKVIQGIRVGTQKISDGINKFLPNLLPNPKEANRKLAVQVWHFWRSPFL